MARMKRRMEEKTGKQGQLFLLEVFIALTVLVLLMTAVYQVEFTTVPDYQDDLSIIGYNALEAINSAGELKPLVYSENRAELIQRLDEVLSGQVLWRLSVLDDSGTPLFQVYWDRLPPANADIGVVDYLVFGQGTTVDDFRTLHLELWRIMG